MDIKTSKKPKGEDTKMAYDVQEIYNALLKEGYEENDIKDKIERKVREFSGFLTNEGAIFLVAKELGMKTQSPLVDKSHYQLLDYEIDYDEFTIPIGEVKEGMTNILLLGVICKIFKVHEFKRKDGTFGKVGSFLIADASGVIKVVLWDSAVEMLSKDYFKVGEVIRVINAFSKRGRENQIEVHLSKKGKLILSPEDVSKKTLEELDSVRKTYEAEGFTLRKSEKVRIEDLIDGGERFYSEVIGQVSEILEFKEFDKEDGTKSFLLKFLVEDETSEIPVLLWDMQAVECLKLIEEGMKVKITDFSVKKNDYTEKYEISLARRSSVSII